MQRKARVRAVCSLVVLAACAHQARPATIARSCGQGWASIVGDGGDGDADGSFERQRLTAVIEHVRIEGVAPALARTLASAIRTKPGMTFGEAPFKDDLQRLFSLGVISDAHLETDEAGDVAFVVTPLARIAAVHVHAPERDSVRRFALLPGAPFEPHRLWRMASALEEEYVRDGHLDASVHVAQSPSGPDVEVCVVADPGPRVTVGSLTFRGRRGVPEADLRKVMHTEKVNRPGKLYDPDALAIDVLYLSAAYWDHGYAMVHLGDPVLVRHGAKLAIELPITEGEQFRLSAVRVSGIRGAATAVHAGEMFSRTRIADARDALEKQLGVTVLPLTKVDAAHRTIDLTFEPQWRWPWDGVVRALSQ